MFYENLNYINAESLIAEVKQELKSYFESGAISEILIKNSKYKKIIGKTKKIKK
jgi:hypothetical protein